MTLLDVATWVIADEPLSEIIVAGGTEVIGAVFPKFGDDAEAGAG